MKKMLKNKKGLTLVELLAVIVVLGIVAAIAVPAIGGVIEKSRKNADLASLDLIKDAAIRYAMTESPGSNVSVTNVSELTNKGYLVLSDTALQSKSGVSFTSFSVTYNASGGYTVKVFSDASGTTEITESTITS